VHLTEKTTWRVVIWFRCRRQRLWRQQMMTAEHDISGFNLKNYSPILQNSTLNYCGLWNCCPVFPFPLRNSLRKAPITHYYDFFLRMLPSLTWPYSIYRKIFCDVGSLDSITQQYTFGLIYWTLNLARDYPHWYRTQPSRLRPWYRPGPQAASFDTIRTHWTLR
jgi:hypothetical protein